MSDLARRISEALGAGEWQVAHGLLEQWCEQEPTDARSWFNQGLCLVHLGRLGEARHCLERCLVLDPDMTKARSLIDYVRRHRQKSEAAPAQGAQTAREPEPAVPDSGRRAGSSAATHSLRGSRGEWRQGSVIAGRYEVREVARGGMGVVYLAHDRELRRMVAVKTPLAEALASEDGRARFFREAEAWIALGIHPNICTAYYVQEIAGQPRLFIEYVDGGDLDRWLRDGRQLSVELRLDIAVQIARGLHYTNTVSWTGEDGNQHQGLVHRDLKPANVLMTGDGIARVTDFGLVRAETGAGALMPEGELAPELDTRETAAAVRDQVRRKGLASTWETVTMAGGVIGTPPYVAPEIWQGTQRSGILSDIYAFGCMLYELLCGRRPYHLSGDKSYSSKETQLMEWLMLHIREQPPDPAALLPGIDPDLSRIMLACVAKEPAMRPASFAEVRDGLIAAYARMYGKPFPRPEPHPAQLLADSLNNRAVSFMTLGQVRRASEAWRKARAIDPRHREATFNQTLHEWQARGLTDAEVLRRIDEAGRRRAPTWRDQHLVGRLHLFLGDLERAVDSLRLATEDAEASLDARRDLGLALIGLARARGSDSDILTEAGQAFHEVLAAAPEDISAAVGLTAAIYLQGRHQEAEALWAGVVTSCAEDLPEQCEQAFPLFLPEFERRLAIELPAQAEVLAVTGNGQLVCRSGDGITTWSPDTGRRTSALKAPGRARGRSLAVAPANQLMIATGEGTSLVVWDLQRVKQLAECDPQPGYVTTAAVSRDGRLALTGGSDRVLRLWDLSTGSCRFTMTGHQVYVTAAAFLPDSSAALSGDGDGQIRLWDLGTGACSNTYTESHNGQVTGIALTADGTLAVSAGQDGLLQVRELGSERSLRTMKGHQGRVTAVAIHPQGDLVLSGGEDCTLRYWSLSSGSPLRILRFAHPVADLAITHDGRFAAVGHGRKIDIIDLYVARPSQIPLALTEPITARESTRRQRLFTLKLNAARHHLEAGALGQVWSELQEARAIPGFEQHPELRKLSNHILDRCPRLSLLAIGEEQSYEIGRAGLPLARLTPDDRHAVVAAGTAPIQIRELAGGKIRGECSGHRAAVTAVTVSPDQTWLLATTRDGSIHRWNLTSGEYLAMPVQHQGSATGLALTAGGTTVVSAGSDGTILVWQLDSTGSARVLGRHQEAVAALATSTDGRIVASAGWDQTVILWQLQHAVKLKVLAGDESSGETFAILAVAISPDCRLIASAGSNAVIKLWDMASGRCLRSFSEPGSEVTCLAFSPDARFLLSGEKNGWLRLWDIHATSSIRAFEGHTAGITTVDMSRDGRYALSAGSDGMVRLWGLDWEPDLREPEAWAARARPFLEVFLWLRAGSDPQAGPPAWDEQDVKRLVQSLARRGCGHLGQAYVQQQLTSIIKGWSQRRVAEEREVAVRQQREKRQQRVAPLARIGKRLTRNLALKLIIVAAVLLVAAFAVLSLRTPADSGPVIFNDHLRQALRKMHVEESVIRKTPHFVHAYQEQPSLCLSEGIPECLPDELFRHADVVLRPDRHAVTVQNPAAAATDPEFLRSYCVAVFCLPKSYDPRVVDALLDGLRTELPPERNQDIVTILVQMGDPAVPQLRDALTSSVPQVRHSAAWALAEMRSNAAVTALCEGLESGSSTAVEASSTMLQEIITTGLLREEQAFELIRPLATSVDPEVRSNAIFGLATFEDRGPVRELLDQAAEDPEAMVREAAEVTRNQLREARRRQLLGQ
jgi:WD40 repeat protein/serine/threonine protein kinase/Flp pilus assembly protein TadD